VRAAELGKPEYSLLVDWALALDCAGKLDEALEKLNRAATLERSAHVLSLTGMMLAKQGAMEKALNALNEAIQRDANYDMAYAYRGNVFYSQGQPGSARADYQKALSLNPANTVAQQGMKLLPAGPAN
jgi:tetratricopeptide (TPR) repeat protein